MGMLVPVLEDEGRGARNGPPPVWTFSTGREFGKVGDESKRGLLHMSSNRETLSCVSDCGRIGPSAKPGRPGPLSEELKAEEKGRRKSVKYQPRILPCRRRYAPYVSPFCAPYLFQTSSRSVVLKARVSEEDLSCLFFLRKRKQARHNDGCAPYSYLTHITGGEQTHPLGGLLI